MRTAVSAPVLPTALLFPTVAIPTALAFPSLPDLSGQDIPLPQNPVPNQIVITFKPDTTNAERETYIQSLGGLVVRRIDALNTVIIEGAQAQNPAALSASTNVLAASEPDYYVSAQLAVPPSDPFYTQQWALPAIGAPDAWLSLPVTTPKVVVAVIDSGVCANNPDLQGRLLPGWDFVQSDNQPQDDFGHGCGVAGIIAANADDGIGMAGVAPNALILPLRVLDAQGLGTYSDVAAAVVFAADHGAQVINLSLGGIAPSSVLENAVNYAVEHGVTMVASAGNNGGAQVLFPAAYAPVVAVGSVDQNLQISSFSSGGANVDLLAPGRDILTLKRDGSYGTMSGTSFAAPQVAGAAAIAIGQGRTLGTNGGIVRVGGSPAVSTPQPTSSPEPTPSASLTTSQLYYYYEGQKLPLSLAPELIAVRFKVADATQQAAALSQVSALIQVDSIEQHENPNYSLLSLSNQAGVQATVDVINQLRQRKDLVAWVNPVFNVPGGHIVLTDEFIAKFPASWSYYRIQSYNAALGVETLSPLLSKDNSYVLRVSATATMGGVVGVDALTMANAYQESGQVVYAEPNFSNLIRPLQEQLSIPNDTAFGQQWAMRNTGQTVNGVAAGTADADMDVDLAWDITTGSNTITIAIIDGAFDSSHEDLGTGTSKMVAGYDALSGVGGIFPVPQSTEGHGTSVAGLAAGVGNNNLGISGVCRNCRIMPIRIFAGTSAGTSAQIANGINYAWQNGADILSNSWGGGSASTAITDAINAALTSGRGGKGTVVVFAAGNSDLQPVIYPGNLTQVITVSASNLCDQRKSPASNACNYFENWWGPNSGPEVDVSAPGVGNYTTDIMGAGGYDAGNYEPAFNGTSSATPLVSGVVGLMLSLDPNLTAVQVQQLLKSTADDISTAGFDNGTGWGRVNAQSVLQMINSDACLGPVLNSPSEGQVFNTQTIAFSWTALTGCTFSGYTFRIKDTSDMDTGGTTIVDVAKGTTSHNATIGTQYNNKILYWGVRANNAPDGALWSVRSFRIQTPPPNDLIGNATVIGSLPYNTNQSSLSTATTTAGDPSFCQSVGYTVWYRFTSPVAQNLTVNTFGSSYDTVLALFNASTLVSVGCNDDSGGFQSQVNVPVTAGTGYYIGIGRYGSGLVTDADTLVLSVTGDGPANTPPTIQNVTNKSTPKNTPITIPFTIGDAETPLADLTVTGTSSNQTRVPNANIVFGGSGGNRTVTITPATDQTGNATITLTVSDGALTASDTFVLSVVVPPDAIFSDGFEGGNLSAWTSNTNDGGDLSANASAALMGSVGLRAVIDDTTPIYVLDDTPTAEPHYRARFLFDPNSLTMANNDNFTFFSGWQDDPTQILQAQLRRSGSNYQVRVGLLNAGAWSYTAFVTITDAPHLFEIEWQAATSAGANNGGINWWLDEATQLGIGGINNNTYRVDQARLGAVIGIDAGTTGNMFFDGFISRRSTYIGRLVAAPTLASPADAAVVAREAALNLSWNSVTGATQYYAEFSNGTSINLNSGWIAGTSWSPGSQPPGAYTWRVKARDASGEESAWSATRTLTVRPGKPTNLQGTAVSPTQVNLTWTASIDAPAGITGYRIYRGGVQIGTSNASTPSFTDNTAVACAANQYKVRAVKGTVTSTDSNIITVNTPCDLIFSDGFESGNLSAWSASATDGTNLAASAASQLTGSTRGIRAVINDANPLYVQDDTPNAEPRYRARFYFNPNSVTMANNDNFVLLFGYQGASAQVIQIQLRRSGSSYQVRAGTLDDNATWLYTGYVTVSNATHIIELDWKAATVDGANNGSLTLWVDEVQQTPIGSINNDTRLIDRVRLGAIAGIDAGTSGVIFFDAFVSKRFSYIGPEVGGLGVFDEPTETPTVEPTVEPTAEVTDEPTAEITPEATIEPTAEITPDATVEPTVQPSETPTVDPTIEPTMLPFSVPVYQTMDDGAPLWLASAGWQLSADAAYSGLGWQAESGNVETLALNVPVNLAGAVTPTLSFQSKLMSGMLPEVRISLDGVNWQVVASVTPSLNWALVTVDLSAYAGQTVLLQFVWATPAGVGDTWQVDEVTIAEASVLPVPPTEPSGMPTVEPSVTPTATPNVPGSEPPVFVPTPAPREGGTAPEAPADLPSAPTG